MTKSFIRSYYKLDWQYDFFFILVEVVYKQLTYSIMYAENITYSQNEELGFMTRQKKR